MATLEANLREIRQTVYGRDMRKPIAGAIEKTKDGTLGDALEVSRKENTRINNISVTVIAPAEPDYYRLVLSRANGQ